MSQVDWIQISTLFVEHITIPPKAWPAIEITQYEPEACAIQIHVGFDLVKTWAKSFEVVWGFWWRGVDKKNITSFIIYCSFKKDRLCQV